MEIEECYDLLCVKGKGSSFAFEFATVKEICADLQISKMPCLPPYFIGVCNYKGEIVPILAPEGAVVKEEKSVIIIFGYQDYLLGILYYGEPYILEAESCEEIQKPENGAESEEGIWVEKKLIRAGDEIVTVLDMEKIMLNLARYFREEYLGY